MFSSKIFESLLLLSMSLVLMDSMEVPNLSKGHAKVGTYSFMDMKSCGYINPMDVPSSRIVAGTPAVEGEFPWTASIHFKNIKDSKSNDSFICGGALITFDWVLSAAHCVFKLDKSQLKIHLGSVNRYQFHNVYYVTDIIRHPTNDLSLLRLNTPAYPVLMAKHYVINTICLPVANTLNAVDEEALIAGFGAVDKNAKIKSPILLKTVLLIYSYQTCLNNNYSREIICAVESEHMTCFGDSGSALHQFDGKQAVMIGAVKYGKSATKEVCGPGFVDFTRVSYFIDWIFYHLSTSTTPRPEVTTVAEPPLPQPGNEIGPTAKGSLSTCVSQLILTLISFSYYILFL